MGKNSRIPNRWEPYTPLGDRIPGTRFICFKTPLQEFWTRGLTENQRFTPGDLIHMVYEKGEQLGLVVDFTFTDRYYNSYDIIKNGVEYQKIKTVGHSVPDEATVQRFTAVVHQYLARNAYNDKLIGVHCTHGLNRTGYIVCKYMIDHLNFEPDAAIEAFNTARGHAIEREYYLCALRGGTAEEIAELQKRIEVEHDAKVQVPQQTPKKRKKSKKSTPKKTDGKPNGAQGCMNNFKDRSQFQGSETDGKPCKDQDCVNDFKDRSQFQRSETDGRPYRGQGRMNNFKDRVKFQGRETDGRPYRGQRGQGRMNNSEDLVQFQGRETDGKPYRGQRGQGRMNNFEDRLHFQGWETDGRPYRGQGRINNFKDRVQFQGWEMDGRPYRGQGRMNNFKGQLQFQGSSRRSRGGCRSALNSRGPGSVHQGMRKQGTSANQQEPGRGQTHSPGSWEGFDFVGTSPSCQGSSFNRRRLYFNRQQQGFNLQQQDLNQHGQGFESQSPGFHEPGSGFSPNSNSQDMQDEQTEHSQPDPADMAQSSEGDVLEKTDLADLKNVLRARFEMGMEITFASTEFKRIREDSFSGNEESGDLGITGTGI